LALKNVREIDVSFRFSLGTVDAPDDPPKAPPALEATGVDDDPMAGVMESPLLMDGVDSDKPNPRPAGLTCWDAEDGCCAESWPCCEAF